MAEVDYCSYVVKRVNSHASSVPQWRTHVSHTLVYFLDTAALPGCLQGCLGSAHPVKTAISEKHVKDLNHANAEPNTCNNTYGLTVPSN